jgi:hypothetical protein
VPAVKREMDVVTPAGIRPSTTYFPELESLRGVAILLIVVFHAYAMLAPTAAGVTVRLLKPCGCCDRCASLNRAVCYAGRGRDRFTPRAA